MGFELFKDERCVGIFRGFSQGGLEFHADLILPYRSDFQSIPMHGQFVAIQLEGENEGVLGRITGMSSQGRLASESGEDYAIRALVDNREIPDDLREDYLKYQVDIRVLGVVRVVRESLVFAPSHRRLPHYGSKVAFLSEETLREIAGHNLDGAELGYYSLGEFVYAQGDQELKAEPWMIVRGPKIVPRFPVQQLVARRSFVFARAGFGKSNLVKLLFSNLYKETPTVEKRAGRRVPVGTLIFDPDGEYFWPDDKNRPGLCDVPELRDQVVVFTRRRAPSGFYQSFVASDIKLDIRRLRPADVISIALSPEKQDQQNVRKLKSLNDSDWVRLVDACYADGNNADANLIRQVLRLEPGQDAETFAARANVTTIAKMLHEPSSQMLDMLLRALKAGKICVVDVSQMRGAPALVLSGLILQRIFDHNQEEFTKAKPETIPTIAVLEEAQSVLGREGGNGDAPYVTWVKEGRKYDLGAVLVTQQPGSIPSELLSQGDNWFVFHLLSAGDLQAVKKANAHFSDDLLSTLLNEPIPGNGVYWSSAGGKSYPIPIRVKLFESLYQVRDPTYNQKSLDIFASKLKLEFRNVLTRGDADGCLFDYEEPETLSITSTNGMKRAFESLAMDPMHVERETVFRRVQGSHPDVFEKIGRDGYRWKDLQGLIYSWLPNLTTNQERAKRSYQLVTELLNETYGRGGWKTAKRIDRRNGTRSYSWILTVGGSDDPT